MREENFVNAKPWANSVSHEATKPKKSARQDEWPPVKEGTANANGSVSETEFIDFEKITTALSESPPTLPTPTAESVSGYNSETEVSNWATDFAMSDPKLSRWASLAKGTIEELSHPKQRLETLRSRLINQLANEPDEIEIPVKLDQHNLGGPILFTPSRFFVLLGVLAAISVASTLLGFEFIFEKEVALQSDWGFAQSDWGARGLVFAISFGSFVALTFWLYAEQIAVHSAVRLVSRTGAYLSVIGVSVIGFALGGTHVEDDALFGWPMLIVPLSAGVLICGAMGAKELAVWIGKMAFPTKRIPNPILELVNEKLAEIEKCLGQLIKRESNARELSKRVETVKQEFVSRVLALWSTVKKYEKVQEQSRMTARSKALADVEATLAQNTLDELKQPE